MLKQVCEWYDFVLLENVTSRAWAWLFRPEFIKWHNVHSDLFLKFEFSWEAQVLALITIMKNNNTSSTKLIDSGLYHLIGCSCVN